MLRRSLRPALAALSAIVLLGLAACSGDDDSSDTATDPETSETSSAAGASYAAGTAECSYPADPSGAAKPNDPPPDVALASGPVDVTITTSAGDVSATLDADATPCTVSSFLSLADQGYFDDTMCHRLTTEGIFVLQCGDPTASGTGGPGYAFADELSGSETYGPGTLAMANAGPSTNGSQFFLVYADSPLPPAYNVFGSFDADSVAVVEAVADAGTADGAPDGAPKDPVTIESVTVG